jgi:transposase
MGYPEAAWERAMTVREVMFKAISGEIHWFRAAEILGWSPRTLRRWRERYETDGYAGLLDKRLYQPSVHRAPAGEVERVLRLYRERYHGFNVRHFHEIARREHAVTLSYSWVKQALQAAGLVKKPRARGRHRRRREPKACFGELVHIDGSTHAWFAVTPDARPTLIAVPDDATNQVLYAQFAAAETTQAVMTALHEVFTTYGLPMALYSDRAHWAFHTPTAKGPVDKRRLTQVGRALAQLGVDHIPSYSPQARGRSERLNRTFQDRLVNELRLAGISTLAAANAYVRDVFLPHHNATFSHPPRDPASAWVGVGEVDLDQILCHQETRTVAQDNIVAMDRLACRSANSQAAGAAPASRWSSGGISAGSTRFGEGPSGSACSTRPDSLCKLSGPRTPRTRPPPLGKRPERVSHSSHRPHFEKRSDHLSKRSGQITCQQQQAEDQAEDQVSLVATACGQSIVRGPWLTGPPPASERASGRRLESSRKASLSPARGKALYPYWPS